jgi:hypothetical protein
MNIIHIALAIIIFINFLPVLSAAVSEVEMSHLIAGFIIALLAILDW